MGHPTVAPTDVVLLLHRLTLDEGERRALTKLGVRILSSGSLGRTLRLMAEPAARVLLAFDVSGGGNGPEKIVAAAREVPFRERIDLLPASSQRTSAAALRAQRLGFPEAWVWPHGAFAECLRRLEGTVQISFHRAAPRAQMGRSLGRMELGNGIAAEIMNISSTGALLETDQNGGDIEAIGFEISLGDKTFVIVARVVWREGNDRRLRLGVQFLGADAESRAAIESFVRSVNTLRPGEQAGELRFGQPERRPARVRHDKRSDWFEVEGDLERGASLIPRKAFFVPYRVGDNVTVEVEGAGGKRTGHAMRIIASSLVEPRRIDSRIAWHIVPVELGAPAGDNPTERELSMGTALLEEQGTKVADLVRAYRAGRLSAELGDMEWALLTPQLLRPTSEVPTGGVYTRTFFSKRQREGAADIDANFVMLKLPITAGAPTVIGRSRSCGVHLPILNVSKRHAQVELGDAPGSLRVTDLESSNGTSLLRLLSGQPALTRLVPHTPAALDDGEIVLIGRHPLHLLSRARLEAAIAALSGPRPAGDPVVS
jgi:PilZ domain/FHA domain